MNTLPNAVRRFIVSFKSFMFIVPTNAEILFKIDGF